MAKLYKSITFKALRASGAVLCRYLFLSKHLTKVLQIFLASNALPNHHPSKRFETLVSTFIYNGFLFLKPLSHTADCRTFKPHLIQKSRLAQSLRAKSQRFLRECMYRSHLLEHENIQQIFVRIFLKISNGF